MKAWLNGLDFQTQYWELKGSNFKSSRMLAKNHNIWCKVNHYIFSSVASIFLESTGMKRIIFSRMTSDKEQVGIVL